MLSSSPAPPANPGRWRGRSDQSQRRQAQAEAQGREVSRHPFGPIAPVRDRRQLGQIDRDFRARQCEARRDTDHRRPSLLSGALGRLPTRSARCREHGGQHRPALEPPRLLVAEALGARDLSGLAANMSTPISTNSYFATTAAFIGTSRSKRSSNPTHRDPETYRDIISRDAARQAKSINLLPIDRPESAG